LMMTAATISEITATTTSVINSSLTASSEVGSTTTAGPSILPTASVHAPIFLETKAAQGIAGAFVWIALFLTCQQIKTKIKSHVTNVIFKFYLQSCSTRCYSHFTTIIHPVLNIMSMNPMSH
ncbi:hypothetical protein L9F63_013708, partial [Diploptera punctata]